MNGVDCCDRWIIDENDWDGLMSWIELMDGGIDGKDQWDG